MISQRELPATSATCVSCHSSGIANTAYAASLMTISAACGLNYLGVEKEQSAILSVPVSWLASTVGYKMHSLCADSTNDSAFKASFAAFCSASLSSAAVVGQIVLLSTTTNYSPLVSTLITAGTNVAASTLLRLGYSLFSRRRNQAAAALTPESVDDYIKMQNQL